MAIRGVYPTLNRLLTILERSLPRYLSYACPWTRDGDDTAIKALGHVVDDQQRLANRIAEHIMDDYGRVELGEFPIDFPDTHDLSLDYLLTKLVHCQRNDIAAIEACIPPLQPDRQAVALAEEALGAARGHLETFEDLARSVKPSSWSR